MKKMMMTLMAMMMITVSASAMSYEQARNEALFLTDKMAYELNLTDEQYEAAYEINLDYLMGVTSRADVFGTYWERRNLDLSYILLDWQWNAFLAASYFYRPLYWEAGYWHFGIYARYPHRDYFYFGRPHFYATYRGGHAWHAHGGHGYYYGHRDHFRTPAGRSHIGMHDRWNRGDFRGGQRSSTRVTGRADSRGRIESNRRIEGNRGIEGNRRFEGRSGVGTSRMGNRQMDSHRSYDRSSNLNSNSRSTMPSRSIGSGTSTPSRNFGSSRSNTAPTRSFGSGSSASRSSMGSSRSSGSFSSGSHGSSSHSGGSHFSGSHSSSHSGGRR